MTDEEIIEIEDWTITCVFKNQDGTCEAKDGRNNLHIRWFSNPINKFGYFQASDHASTIGDHLLGKDFRLINKNYHPRLDFSTNVWILNDESYIHQQIDAFIKTMKYVNAKGEMMTRSANKNNHINVVKKFQIYAVLENYMINSNPYISLCKGKPRSFNAKLNIFIDHIIDDVYILPFNLFISNFEHWNFNLILTYKTLLKNIEILCPHIFKFLEEALDFDNERKRLLRIVKALITGELNEKRMSLFLTGVSGSAKSTFIRVLSSFYNNNVKNYASLSDLEDKFVRSNLKGKIINISDDEPSMRLKKELVAIFETLLGGLPLPNYIKHRGQGEDWNNQSNLIITSNGLYQLPDDEIASILNRSVVFFLHKSFISEDNQKDSEFEKEMIGESEGFYNLLQMCNFDCKIEQKPDFINFTEYWKILSDPIYNWVKLSITPSYESKWNGTPYSEDYKGITTKMGIKIQDLAESCDCFLINAGFNSSSIDTLKRRLRKILINMKMHVVNQNGALRLIDGSFDELHTKFDIRLKSLSLYSSDIKKYVSKKEPATVSILKKIAFDDDDEDDEYEELIYSV